MAINAVGMTGTVSQVEDARRWAIMAPLFQLSTPTDLAPTVSTTTNLTINIGLGAGVCCGVRADSTTAATVAVAANTSGATRMDSVVFVFDWTARTVSFQVLTGNSPTVPIVPTQNPGVLFQVVLAYVYVRNGVGLIQAADLTDVRGGGLFPPAPGVIRRGRRITQPPATAAVTSATAQSVLSLSNVPVTAGRLYKISTSTLGVYVVGATQAGGVMQNELKYTTDGSTPTVNSPVLLMSKVPLNYASADAVEATSAVHYIPTATGKIGVLLDYFSANRGGGSSVGLVVNADISAISLYVEDVGADPGDTGTSY